MPKMAQPADRVDQGGDWLCVHDEATGAAFLYSRSTIDGAMPGAGVYVADWMGEDRLYIPLTTPIPVIDLVLTPRYHRCWFAIAVSI